MKKILFIFSILLLFSSISAYAKEISPLIKAVKLEDFTQVEEMLNKSKKNIDDLDRNGKTALFYAVDKHSLDLTNLLLKSGANPNKAGKQFGRTPLMQAARNGDTDIAELLIRHGANVNSQSLTGWTALMYAVTNNYVKPEYRIQYRYNNLIALLLTNNADVNIVADSDWTALTLAKEKGNTEAINLLLQYSPRIIEPQITNTQAINTQPPAQVILPKKNTVEKKEIETPTKQSFIQKDSLSLINAVINKDLALATEILNKSKNSLEIINTELGWTALFFAVDNNNLSMVNLLLNRGANPNAVCTQFSRTPLMVAARSGYINIAKALIKHGANVNMQADTGWTALMYAAQSNYEKPEYKTQYRYNDFIKLLLENGANVNLRSNSGWTAFMVAAGKGNIEAINLLLKHDPDINIVANSGETALTTAKIQNRTEIVNLLKEYGAK